MTSVVAIELAGLYTQLGMYEKAEQTVRTSTQVGKRKNQIPRFSVMADLYLQMGNLDSAAYYYHRLLEFDNYYSKQGGYEGLSKICRQRHQYKEALEYIDIYLAYTDSIKKHTDTETIRKMHSLYNYQLREKENQRLKDINTRQNTQVVGLLFILILSAVSVFSYSQYSRRKKEQKREQQRRLEEEKERQYRKSLQFYRRKQEAHPIFGAPATNVKIRKRPTASRTASCTKGVDRRHQPASSVSTKGADTFRSEFKAFRHLHPVSSIRQEHE